VLLFPAFDGWSAFLEEYAAFFASKNMVCVAVDYYGQRQRGTTLEECFSLVTPYLQNRQIVRERATAIFHFFEKMFPNLDIGAMGFCFGVQSVLELARTQQNLKVAIGAHGLLKSSELPTLETIKSHVLMLQGYSDPMVPPQECLDFAAEMRQHHVADWNLVFFGEVAHSFTDPNTGSFDPLKEREIGRIFDKLAAERVKKWSKHFFQQIFTEK
jgi:dienelactone hydrolase